MYKMLPKLRTSCLLKRFNSNLRTSLRNLVAQHGNFKAKLECDKAEKQDVFIPVYKFPGVRVLSAVNRLKIYQSAATGFAIPACLLSYKLNMITFEVVSNVSILGITTTLTLFTVGYLSQNFIGFMYLNQREDEVKVSYCDFWGRRRDETLPISDVVPLSELPVSKLDAYYYKFQRYSTNHVLKLTMRNADVLDGDKFNKIMLKL